MAIAKRKLHGGGVEGSEQTDMASKHVDRSHGPRKDKHPVLRSKTSSNDKKVASAEKESGDNGADATTAVETRRHRVGTFETVDGVTWKATIQGDIEKFMFPSLRLEALYTSDPSAPVGAATASSRTGRAITALQPSPSPDQVERLLAATKMAVEWEMQPRSTARKQPASQVDGESDKRAAFDRKLEATEALLCEKQYDESLLLTQTSELEA